MAKFCRKCGVKVDEKADICPNCGAKVSPEKRKRSHVIIIFVVCLVFALLFVAIFLYRWMRRTQNDVGKQIEVGETIEFGSYEQDNNVSNGKEPIEWIVLKSEDDHALLMSVNCLDYKSYNTESTEATWETSSLREWLNNEFMDEAFSARERKRVRAQTIENLGLYAGMDEDGSWIVTNSEEYVKNVLYQTEDSNETEDRVYLLSADESILYLSSGDVERPPLTEYAEEKFLEATLKQAEESGYNDEEAIRERYAELEEKYGEGCCYWWLRSPGISDDTAAVVSYEADEIQIQNLAEGAAIRPVLWIETN